MDDIFSMTEDKNGNQIHPFEQKHKRPYPYRYIGPGKGGALGTVGRDHICDHCGCSKLQTKYWIRAANELVFGVGSQCVRLLELTKEEYKKFRNDFNKRNKDMFWQKFDSFIASNKDLLVKNDIYGWCLTIRSKEKIAPAKRAMKKIRAVLGAAVV